MSSLNGEIIACGQRTGGDIPLHIYGDEFYARYETVDGYTVVYDSDLGRYCYATLAAGRLVSTGVHTGKPVPAEIRRHLKEGAEVRNEKFGRRYEQLRPRESDSGSMTTRTLGPDDGLLEGRKHFSGHVRGLTILVDFDDLSSNISNADVDDMLNEDDYTRNGNFCSVKKYFQLVSNGKLTYTNTVVGPVKLPRRRSHYISTLMVREVMDAVVNDFHINLSDFDSRGEGIVDAINILYAGESQYSGELWPHNSVRELEYNGVRTHFYLLTGLGEEPVDLRIGTICHENGHLLCRFPDMYDYGKRDGDHEKSQGIGRYCLMGSGNHLNDRRTPSPVCAYLRELVGWADDVVLLNDATGQYTARHGSYGTIMKYETDLPNEYFVVENRSRMGLDSHLPSSGLAIYHCDTLGSNEWQAGTRNRHYQCALLQADGHLDLENNRNAGDSGDLFADVATKALSHDTTPSSRQWDGLDSNLTVSEIGAAGADISLTIGEPQQLPVTHGESTPNLLIIDNDRNGVQDAIPVAATGNATAIAVSVEIIHSWISDLELVLIAPDGTQVMLHNKEGADGDDLFKTYKSTSGEPLQAIVGKPVHGDWILHLTDTAPRDVGRLVHWSIDLDYAKTGGIAVGEGARAVAIPDDNTEGVTSVINLSDEGNVNDISVDVDINHTYIGDLQLDLISPAGVTSRLHNNAGAFRHDIKRAFDLDSTPELQRMQGQPVKGDWMLRILDIAPEDEGRLNNWSIRIGY